MRANFIKGIALLILATTISTAARDLSGDEIVARHLDSIAPASARHALKTLMLTGPSEFESAPPLIRGGGKVVVVSDRSNFYFLMSLNSRDYPFEKIGYFGKDVSLPFISPGHRSFLGGFLADNSVVLREGLFGGPMSLRWTDRLEDRSRLKFKNAGVKKVDGREMYAVDVEFAKEDPSEFHTRLFFDKTTFELARSEYEHEMQVSSPAFGRQNQTLGAEAQVVEEFTDYKDEGGFKLPHRDKITFTTNSAVPTARTSWTVNASNYYFDQKLTPDFFTFDPQ